MSPLNAYFGPIKEYDHAQRPIGEYEFRVITTLKEGCAVYLDVHDLSQPPSVQRHIVLQKCRDKMEAREAHLKWVMDYGTLVEKARDVLYGRYPAE